MSDNLFSIGLFLFSSLLSFRGCGGSGGRGLCLFFCKKCVREIDRHRQRDGDTERETDIDRQTQTDRETIHMSVVEAALLLVRWFEVCHFVYLGKFAFP